VSLNRAMFLTIDSERDKFFTEAEFRSDLFGYRSPNKFFFVFLIEDLTEVCHIKDEGANEVPEDLHYILESTRTINEDCSNDAFKNITQYLWTLKRLNLSLV